MPPLRRTGGILVAVCTGCLMLAGTARAQDGAVQNQISVYSGPNAQGYLQPLASAFGATLNSSFSYSAYIPPTSFHLSLEVPVMGVFFEDADRTFMATTESGFLPQTTRDVPTVVGSGKAVIVDGNGGAQFAFPGGLDLNSFGLAVPQLRVSSLAGTEAVVRWVAYETGDSDVGKINLFGIGGRHSVSQYLGDEPPLDLALGLMWQSFDVGESNSGGDFVSTSAFLAEVQASKRAPLGFLTLEPYASVAYEKLNVDVAYDDDNGNPVTVELEGENDVRFTVGAGLNFAAGHLWADYSFANMSSFSFGLALGNVAH
ncbi:MAG TPA: DUF6588 family protein [Candidatus Krumholzibacteria bacterium]|nr:DUF6588 family protein [Candidatus Krumholzibacteria bacterium]